MKTVSRSLDIVTYIAYDDNKMFLLFKISDYFNASEIFKNMSNNKDTIIITNTSITILHFYNTNISI